LTVLFTAASTQAEARLKWLDRQPEFAPPPYRQLAKVLRELGDDDGAKCVLHELETRTRVLRRRSLNWPLRWFRFGEDVFSDATVGYGIHPGSRAVFVGIDSSGLARALAGTTDEGDGANG